MIMLGLESRPWEMLVSIFRSCKKSMRRFNKSIMSMMVRLLKMKLFQWTLSLIRCRLPAVHPRGRDSPRLPRLALHPRLRLASRAAAVHPRLALPSPTWPSTRDSPHAPPPSTRNSPHAPSRDSPHASPPASSTDVARPPARRRPDAWPPPRHPQAGKKAVRPSDHQVSSVPRLHLLPPVIASSPRGRSRAGQHPR